MITSVELLTENVLPKDGPCIIVVPEDAGPSPKDRYLWRLNAKDVLVSSEPLVAIKRYEPLGIPDQIRITGASHEGSTYHIKFETRVYEGDLAANVTSTALVQVGLGRLPPGHYEVIVIETSLRFFEIEHPEDARDPVEKSCRFGFQVY